MDRARKYMDRYSDEKTRGNYKKSMLFVARGILAYVIALKIANHFLL